MKKSDVNGDNTNPVYKWLKNEKPGILGLTRIKVCGSMTFTLSFSRAGSPQWNFEKFLIDQNGSVVNRWASTTTPQAIDTAVEKLLEDNSPKL